MARERYRLQFKFWLDLKSSNDEIVADQIEILKNERSFTSVVKDGVMLVSELRQGRVDLLLKMFPWVADVFSNQGTSNHDSDNDLNDLRHQIARLEQLLLAQGTQPNSGLKMNNLGGPKPLNVSQIAGPQYSDDEGMLVIKKARSDGSSAKNFLESAFNLVQ